MQSGPTEYDVSSGVPLAQPPAIIYTRSLDEGYPFVYISENVSGLLGDAAQRFLATPHSWRDAIQPEDTRRVIDGFDSLMRHGYRHVEYRLRLLDGTYRWVCDEQRIVHAGDGRPTAISGCWLAADGSRVGRNVRGDDYTACALLRDAHCKSPRECEESFNYLAHLSPVGIFRTDAQGRYLYVNECWCEIAGIEADQAIGNGWFESLHRDDRARIEREWRQALADGSVFRSEFRFQRNDGAETWLLGKAVVQKEGSGKVLGYVGTITDVTENIKKQHELRELASGLAEAQRSTHHGNWELDIVNDKLTWSDEVYRIIGVEPGSFGESYEAFLKATHPDDRERVNRVYLESLENREPYDITHRLLLKDGTIKYVRECCHSLFDDQDRAIRSVGTIQDITERVERETALRNSERIWRSMAKNSPDYIIMLDCDLRIQYVNKVMSGVALNEVVGASIYDYFPQGSRDVAKRCYQQVVESGEPYRFEMESDYNGEKLFYEANIGPVMEEDEVISLIINVRDISRRKRLELKLRQSAAVVESTAESVFITDHCCPVNFHSKTI